MQHLALALHVCQSQHLQSDVLTVIGFLTMRPIAPAQDVFVVAHEKMNSVDMTLQCERTAQQPWLCNEQLRALKGVGYDGVCEPQSGECWSTGDGTLIRWQSKGMRLLQAHPVTTRTKRRR